MNRWKKYLNTIWTLRKTKTYQNFPPELSSSIFISIAKCFGLIAFAWSTPRQKENEIVHWEYKKITVPSRNELHTTSKIFSLITIKFRLNLNSLFFMVFKCTSVFWTCFPPWNRLKTYYFSPVCNHFWPTQI